MWDGSVEWGASPEVLTVVLTSPTGARFPPHRCSPRYQARSADCPSRPALTQISRLSASGQAGLPSTRLRPPSGVCLGPWARQHPHRAPPQAGRGFSIGGRHGGSCRADGVPRPPSPQRNKTLQLSLIYHTLCVSSPASEPELPQNLFIFCGATVAFSKRCLHKPRA